MFFMKKTNYDVLLLILLALRIELDSNIIRYRSWNGGSESRSIRLGSTSAYTQISLSSSHLRYPHPKGLDQNELEEAAILFSRLNYFNSVHRNRDDLITCILNSPDQEVMGTTTDIPNSSENVTVTGDHPLQNLPEVNGGALSELPDSPISLELTPEDMDLIEILWKQDIDLGVSRDAYEYDSRQSVETEKLKEVEFAKAKQKDVKPYEEPILVPDPFEGLNYTIDSETGEYLIDDFSSPYDGNTSIDEFHDIDKNKRLENELLKQNESLGPLNLDTFLPFDDHEFCDITELFSPSELPDLIADELEADPNYFLAESEEVEKELEKYKLLNETNEIGDSARGDMYPNVEDCWPDATTMMPLLALGNSYQGALTPIQNSVTPSTMTSSESLVMPAPIPTSEADFPPISSSLGSSIGYAVAESIATLTNDSDPVPTGSITNNVFGTELPELLYSNHTSAVPHHDLMSELFLDELQLMSLPPNNTAEINRDDQMDTTSDSVSSGHLPSDYHDLMDSCSESSSHNDEEQNRRELLVPNSQMDSYFSQQQDCNLPQAPTLSRKCKEAISRNQNVSYIDSGYQQGDSNDQQYFTLKSYYSDSSENSTCAVSCGIVSFNKKFDYSIPKASGYNCSNFFQHNHTYHVPLSTDDSCHKPFMRDKQRSYSDDEINNKDEKKAKELKLPISISEIINLAIEEYNERLSKYELTEAQITLIRDIRRRGKNKVAAQNCRKRKMDQINNLQHDLDFLQNEKLQLKSKQNHLLQEKHIIEDKYIQLYELVLRSTNSRPPNVPTNLALSNNNGTSTSETLIGNIDSNFNGGARTKKKYRK